MRDAGTIDKNAERENNKELVDERRGAERKKELSCNQRG